MATYSPRKGAGWTGAGLLLLLVGVVLLLGALVQSATADTREAADAVQVMYGVGLATGLAGAAGTAWGVYTLLTMVGSPVKRPTGQR